MKEITKEDVTADGEVYVARDGEKFDSAKKCVEYEEKLKRHEEKLKRYEEELKRAEQYKKLKEIETKVSLDDVTPLDGGEYLEHHDYRWYRPKSIEEVDLLNAFFYVDKGTLTKEHIGEWVCIQNYDIYYSKETPWVAFLKDSIKHIKWFLNEFGYDITNKEREA